MERLSDLPPADATDMTPQESSVMQKYFNAAPNDTASKTSKAGWMDTIKTAFYAAILFVLLANPWIDTILCVVPYCGDSALTLLAVKTLLFMVVFTAMNKFLVN